MFSRRHPYLFFMLVFSSVIAGAVVLLSILFMISGHKSRYAGLNDMGGEKVGVVKIIGVISNSEAIINKIKRFREDNSVKAIILRIDSPGGSVGPSQEIYREIRKTVKKKKVVASLGSVAASGGYYIASASDGIIANPGTITGSIGVIMGFANYRELLEKIGVVSTVIKSGEYKDTGSPVRDMTRKERKMLQDLSDEIHKQFISDVAEGRKMESSKIRLIADGRIFSGEGAKNIGLVDRLGNFEDAIEWAGRMAGIKGKIRPVYIRDKKLSILKYLAESSVQKITNLILNRTLLVEYIYRPL